MKTLEQIDAEIEKWQREKLYYEAMEKAWRESMRLTPQQREQEVLFWKENRNLIYRNIERWKKELAEINAWRELWLRTGETEDGVVKFRYRKAWVEIEEMKVWGNKRALLEGYLSELNNMIRVIKAYESRSEIVDLEMLKQISIDRVLMAFNVEPNRGGFIPSPYHDERTPSCKIYFSGNNFYDFSSGKGGSVIDLVMALDKCGLKEAIEILKTM